VESLSAAAAGSSTTTNIRAGLDEAAKVLERSKGDVAGVILLSDGYDNHSACRRSLPRTSTTTADYGDLVPPYLARECQGWRCTPVHTFAFGSDHDESTRRPSTPSRRRHVAPSPSSTAKRPSRTPWRGASRGPGP
jgi:hypothetical protein